MSGIDARDLPAAELEELLASLAAVRRSLAGRPEALEAEAPAEPAAGSRPDGWLAQLGQAAFGEIGDLDPARWLHGLRAKLPVPSSSDVSDEVDEFGLDRRYLERARPVLDFLFDRWWRVQVTGAGAVPDSPRLLFVSNRSGVLPYDGLMIAHALERASRSARRARPLVAGWLMTRPFAQPVLSRLGAVQACEPNADRLLSRDEWVIAFPEGRKGALKPFRERYRLQRFGRGSFVSLAVRRRVQVVPVAVVGAEEVHPVLRGPGRLRNLVPLPLPITATFPLLGPLGLVPLPSQWRIRFGSAISLRDVDPAAADDEVFVTRTREQVRSAIRELLEEELDQRYSVWS